MAIKAIFSLETIRKQLQENYVEEANRKALRAFKKSCMEAVSYAKSNRAERYTDQTGALNSSTGFQLYKDGELVEGYFVSAEGGDGSGGAKGVEAGSALADKVPKGNDAIVAVLVAGMDYALYVEAKGKDVLSGAKNRFPEILKNNLEIEFSGSGVGFSISVE